MKTSISQGITDIDSLALATRDHESRRLIMEAISAYRGGALRSAIMSTWIAVSFDIISKARELAVQGEAAPKAFIRKLDSAIDKKDIKKLQIIESGLLKIANEELQLFASHEIEALERLQRDRNLCAHPAFIVEDELYQPSLELVRSHIVHALNHLLLHAPLQGKTAIVRFKVEVTSMSFPTNSVDIGVYIREKYLYRAKDVLVINLIKAVLSAPFGEDRSKFTGRSRLLSMTLSEISKAKTSIYEEIMPSHVKRKFDAIEDDVLLTICTFIENDQRIWEWLSEPTRIRIKKLLQSTNVEELKQNFAFDAFAIPELSEILLMRFDGFDINTQISIISEHPKHELVVPGIEIYRQASSFREAEALGQSIIISLIPFLTADNIKVLLNAAQNNGQIWYAGGTAEILESVFDNTQHILPKARPYWQAFVDYCIDMHNGDAENHYSYPGLQKRLVS